MFGVLNLEGEPWTPPPGVTITDPWAAARAAVRPLRAEGARVIIGLFHVAAGPARSRELAAAAAEVDLVVFGHDGTAAPPRFVRSGVLSGDASVSHSSRTGRRLAMLLMLKVAILSDAMEWGERVSASARVRA